MPRPNCPDKQALCNRQELQVSVHSKALRQKSRPVNHYFPEDKKLTFRPEEILNKNLENYIAMAAKALKVDDKKFESHLKNIFSQKKRDCELSLYS